MTMLAAAPATWTVVRCPRHPRRVLGEIQGADAALRKDCPDCPKGSQRWRFDNRTGEYTLERRASC